MIREGLDGKPRVLVCLARQAMYCTSYQYSSTINHSPREAKHGPRRHVGPGPCYSRSTDVLLHYAVRRGKVPGPLIKGVPPPAAAIPFPPFHCARTIHLSYVRLVLSSPSFHNTASAWMGKGVKGEGGRNTITVWLPLRPSTSAQFSPHPPPTPTPSTEHPFQCICIFIYVCMYISRSS